MGSSMRRRRGFSLLEVMLAIAVLAVGTVSVLMVFGTALSFAHRRQGHQQVAQVREEALTAARALVNAYRAPSAAPSAAARGSKDKGAAAGGAASPAGAGASTPATQSAAYAAYTWELHFAAVQPQVPDAGWTTTIVVKRGDREEHRETQTIVPDVIPESEFERSQSFAEEAAGKDSGKAAK